MPERIQRKRTKGYKMPEGSIYVGRPTKWGNMFRPALRNGTWCVVDENDVTYWPDYNNQQSALIKAVSLYHSELVQWSDKHMQLPELRGHDLACWCPLDDGHGNRVPCHADVLLELANPGWTP